jgi:hypothetical protein
MDDRSLVTHLLAIGVAARRKTPDAFAGPADDPNLKSIDAARIAAWLEELGVISLVAMFDLVSRVRALASDFKSLMMPSGCRTIDPSLGCGLVGTERARKTSQ